MLRQELTLYNRLMKLVSTRDNRAGFYAKDTTTASGTPVRIFNYHIVMDYDEWMIPGALECRGIMFELDENQKPVRCMSRPMQKFFNYGELNRVNLEELPKAMGTEPIDLSQIEFFMTKEDGSLISTFHDNGVLGCKSKTSLTSEQAVAATSMLSYMPRHKALHDRLLQLALDGFTVNMEYVSPSNRIVVEYDEEALVVLNVRDNTTGDYVPMSELYKDVAIRPYLVGVYTLDSTPPSDWVVKAKAETDIEGYVVKMTNGLFFKLKTDWYVQQHKAKDSINHNRLLFETIKDSQSDDLKALYAENETALTKINAFETAYLDAIEFYIKSITETKQQLHGLSRKDYYLKAQEILNKENKGYMLSAVMNQFTDDSERVVQDSVRMFKEHWAEWVPFMYK